MIGGGFAGRIGRARIIRGRLREVSILAKRPIDLVRRDVMKAESIGSLAAQPAPMREGGLQQHISSNDVGLDEVVWTIDRTIDVALGGEMHDRVRVERLE